MKMEINFSALVRKIRQSREITQEQLAREIEVTFSTVNAWENGKHQPIPALARRLVDIAQDAGILTVKHLRRARQKTPKRGRRRRGRT
jgi:transcriptional regulator with XRE-family HTH domain